MPTSELLEVGKIFGLILGVWFALVGWKLVPLLRELRSAKAVSEISGGDSGVRPATRVVQDAIHGKVG